MFITVLRIPYVKLVRWQVSFIGIHVGEAYVPRPCISSSLSVIYLNAEGKANSTHQIRVILDTLHKRHGNSWLFLAVSEADYRRSEDYETAWVDGHFVQRYHIAGERAAKLIWNLGCNEYARAVVWAGRTCRVDVDLCNVLQSSLKPFSKFSFVVAHLAHGESWWDSCDDLHHLLTHAPPYHQKHVLADLNVEGRLCAQDQDSLERWSYLISCLSAANLASSLPHSAEDVTRRPAGIASLTIDPSQLDHCFVPNTSSAVGSIVWDDVVGDHAWVNLHVDISDRRTKRRRAKWLYRDIHGFRDVVLESIPSSFESCKHFDKYLAAKIDEYQNPLSSRQRRRCWEPFAVKDLRRRIRECTDEVTRVHLSQRLFKARVAWGEESGCFGNVC